jgi:large subunit ribosomal protein L25
MAISAKLSVTRRAEAGSKGCSKLRAQGQIPGNLYGHKEPPVALACGGAAVLSAIRSGAHVVDVELEGNSTKALLREVQWDSFGNEVVHFDLMRVDPHERLTVEVHVELKGTAPGTLSGGVLDHALRTLTVECPAIEIPDNIVVKIGAMEVGSMIHVRELEIPPNITVLNNPESIVVRIAKQGEVPEVGAAAPGEEGPAQPEVIGRKPSEEGEEEEPAEKKK